MGKGCCRELHVFHAGARRMSNKGKWKEQVCACAGGAAQGCLTLRPTVSLHPAARLRVLQRVPVFLHPAVGPYVHTSQHEPHLCSRCSPDSVFCYPLPPEAISSYLFSPLFQRLTLFAAWLYRAKVSGHADKIRRWLLSKLLFSSLKT